MKKILVLTLICLCAVSCKEAENTSDTKVLYNGIELPDVWPPHYPLPTERTEMPLPYIDNRPETIIANIGRQLFVDDFLIDSTDLKRVCHHAEMYAGNPVIDSTEPWEMAQEGVPFADPFSGGAWYDEKDGKFKMFYRAGRKIINKAGTYTAYAESEDGVNWTKPILDIVEGTNVIDTLDCDSRVYWLDKLEKDPSKRFKAVIVGFIDGECRQMLKYSHDGIHWSDTIAVSQKMQDRSTFFYNPFRKKWIMSERIVTLLNARSRAYAEDDDLENAVRKIHWLQDEIDLARDSSWTGYTIKDEDMVYWFTADDKDTYHPYPDISERYKPAIYNFDAIAYESILLGMYAMWKGPENWECERRMMQKYNVVGLGYSRDGFHLSRPDHEAFIGGDMENEDAWNWGDIQPAAGNAIIVGDSLYFYCSGRRHNDISPNGWTATGLAKLRRDGFVSMDADSRGGTLTTWPLSFDGKYFFVNAAASSLAVEILDREGRPVPGYSKEDCIVLKKFDSTKIAIRWKGHSKLSKLACKDVRVRFHMTDGELFSFWVSPWKTGESRGYLGGGGPGLNPCGIDQPLLRRERVGCSPQ